MYKNEERFCMTDWEFVGLCGTSSKLFRNRFTGKHCEQYLLKLYSEHEKLCFQYRVSSQCPFIVKVLHFECFSNFDQANIFTHYNARIFIEHIRFRLSDIGQLPDNYIYGLLEDTLEGFSTIYSQFQPVRVTDSMVCINEDKKIKVWLSPTLIDNYVRAYQAVSQQTMIADIFEIYRRFSECCDDRPGQLDFEQAFEYLEAKKITHLKKVSWESSVAASSEIAKTLKSIARSAYKTGNQTSTTISLQPHSAPQNKNASMISTRSNRLIGEAAALEQRGHVHSMIDRKSPARNLDASREDQPGSPHHKRESIVVRIESARTTSKNISVHYDFVELDKNQLQQELLDEKKTKEARLQIVKMARLNHPHDQNVQRICQIFSHALKFDPLMYHELRKAHGRISRVNNSYVLKKIIQMTELDPKKSVAKSPEMPSRAIRIRTHNETPSPQIEKTRDRVKNILESQRQKRHKNRTVYNKKCSVNDPVNRPPNEKPQPKYHSEIKHNKKEEEGRKVPEYISQLEDLIGPTSIPHEDCRPKPAPITQSKKKEKTKFYKDFKEEVQKLLFD